jgi:hypothetical protein
MLGDMKVRRVDFGGGHSGIEPAYDPDWSPLTRLRWAAAVEMLDSPVQIHVSHGASRSGDVVYDDFCVSVPFIGFGSTDFESARLLIMGIGAGAKSLRQSERS